MASIFALAGSALAGFVESATTFGIADGDSMSFTAGFVDFDGDTDPDFFVTNHWRSASFFRNDGGVAVESSGHLDGLPQDRHDQLWADLDNDGDPDQYLALGGDQGNQLFWNVGWGSLVEGAAAAGAEDPDGRGREIALADFDGDHLVDIFVANDLRAGFVLPSALFWNNGDGTFSRDPDDDPLFRSRHHVASADFDLDGDPDLVLTDGFFAGELMRNDGNAWVDVTPSVFPGAIDPLIDGQGLSWADYDNDGDLDLFVTRGNRGIWEYADLEGDSLRFYTASDGIAYRELVLTTEGDSVRLAAATEDYKSVTCFYGEGGDSVNVFPRSFGIDEIAGQPPTLGGVQGLFLWSLEGGPVDTVRFVVAGPGPGDLTVGGDLRTNGTGILDWSAIGFAPPPPYSRRDWSNRLFRNDGGVFRDVSAQAFAVNDSTANSKGGAWADYDNDGWIDVYVPNGGTIAVGNEGNFLYRNNGDGTFEQVAGVEGVVGSNRGMSDGAAWGDVNEDGFLDLFVDHGAESPPFGVGPRELFVNVPNANHWLSLALRGIQSNGSGIGARVRVVSAGGTQWRVRLGDGENGFSSADRLHFGLGSSTVVDTLQIFWPSGIVDTHLGIAADERYTAVEGDALRFAGNPAIAVSPESIFDELLSGQLQTYSVAVDNPGGVAARYAVRYEDCAGMPISWVAVEPESSTVFPGGTPLELTIDTSFLAPGPHCGRVVFEAVEGSPDTLVVNLMIAGGAVDAPAALDLPETFALSLARPNPSRGAVGFSLALPFEADVLVTIHDLAGRRLKTIEAGRRAAGRYELAWNGHDEAGHRVAPGIYLVRAVGGGELRTTKVVLLD